MERIDNRYSQGEAVKVPLERTEEVRKQIIEYKRIADILTSSSNGGCSNGEYYDDDSLIKIVESLDDMIYNGKVPDELKQLCSNLFGLFAEKAHYL